MTYRIPGPNWKPRTKADFIKLIVANSGYSPTYLKNREKDELIEMWRKMSQEKFMGLMKIDKQSD